VLVKNQETWQKMETCQIRFNIKKKLLFLQRKGETVWGQNRKTETDENYLKFSSDYIKIII